MPPVMPPARVRPLEEQVRVTGSFITLFNHLKWTIHHFHCSQWSCCGVMGLLDAPKLRSAELRRRFGWEDAQGRSLIPAPDLARQIAALGVRHSSFGKPAAGGAAVDKAFTEAAAAAGGELRSAQQTLRPTPMQQLASQSLQLRLPLVYGALSDALAIARERAAVPRPPQPPAPPPS